MGLMPDVLHSQTNEVTLTPPAPKPKVESAPGVINIFFLRYLKPDIFQSQANEVTLTPPVSKLNVENALEVNNNFFGVFEA